MSRHFNKSDSKSVRRNLRASMPSAEAILWSVLKDRRLLGCKFRRQYGIEAYTVDFYSPDIKLVIELDGDSHYRQGEQEYDKRRDAMIRSFGIRILRILNDDVYENLDGVWDAIARVAREQIELLRPLDQPGRPVRRARRVSKTGDATPPAPPCEGGEPPVCDRASSAESSRSHARTR
jgi:very-short-patch-repair endonuclease